MSHLRRVTYTKPIPAGAEIVTRKGERFARFKRRGKTVEAPLTEDGTRIRLLSKKWYGEYTDPDGKEHCVPLATDRTAAEQMLAKLVKKAERRTADMEDRFEEHHKRPLLEHLEDYRRHLETEGDSADHVLKTAARARTVLDGCGFAFIRDLSDEKVAVFLHGLRRDPPRPALPPAQEWFRPRELAAALGSDRPPRLARLLRREGLAFEGTGSRRRYPRATVEALQDHILRGVSASTSNHYLDAMKGFTRWLWEKKRTDADRLASLKPLNPELDRRHVRRELPEAELRVVLATAGASAATFEGLAGPDRVMLYATAMVTGFRASELASLGPRSFDLDAGAPAVTVRAAHSKNRRTSVQPLPPDVAAALRDYLAGRPAGKPVWPGRWYKAAAEMLRVDLAAAGIPYRDEDGRVADFHALRHSYITLLERSGVSPKLAQELARHSDIRLTMNVYTHARLHDLAGAVDGLPALLPKAPGTEALAATGTEGGLPAEKAFPAFPPAFGKGEAGHVPLRIVDGGAPGTATGGYSQNSRENKGFAGDCHLSGAAEGESAAGPLSSNQADSTPFAPVRRGGKLSLIVWPPPVAGKAGPVPTVFLYTNRGPSRAQKGGEEGPGLNVPGRGANPCWGSTAVFVGSDSNPDAGCQDWNTSPRGPLLGGRPGMRVLLTCPSCGAVLAPGARRCRSCRLDLREAEESFARWGSYVRRDCEPHRGLWIVLAGNTSVVLAAVALCLFGLPALVGLPLGVVAWVMGNADLAKIRAGQMDPQGLRQTRSGREAGIVGATLSGAVATCYLALFLLMLPWR